MSTLGRRIEKHPLANTLTKVEDVVESTRFRSSVTLSCILGSSARSLAAIEQGLAIFLALAGLPDGILGNAFHHVVEQTGL